MLSVKTTTLMPAAAASTPGQRCAGSPGSDRSGRPLGTLPIVGTPLVLEIEHLGHHRRPQHDEQRPRDPLEPLQHEQRHDHARTHKERRELQVADPLDGVDSPRQGVAAF